MAPTEEKAGTTASEAVGRLLAEQTLVGLAVIQDGVIKYVNEVVSAINGYSVEEMLGWKPRDFGKVVHPDDRAFAVGQAEKKQRGDRNVEIRYQYRIIRKSGEVRWLDQYSRSIELDGRPANLICITDITDLKAAEAERMELQQKLLQSQKMEALGTLAGGVAHDINNVLSGIVMYASLLPSLSDGSEPSEATAILDLCKRGKKLADDILSYARRDQLERAPVHVPDLLRRVVEVITKQAPDRVRIHLETLGDIDPVEGDRDRLAVALTNLCRNGIDAIDGAGSLRIACWMAASSEAQEQAATGRHVCIVIEDSGSGMDQETLARAHEPFFTTKATGLGTGLGLSMASGVVSSHGGVLRLDSSVGRGTTVTILLPVADRRSATTPTDSAWPDPAP